MDVEAGLGGEGDGGQQDLVLGLEPGQRLPVVGGLLRGAAPGPGGARATGSWDGFSRWAAWAAVCR